MTNPFITKGYAGPEFFCDREQETQTLVELTTNGNNMALIAPRRIGKTDLIQHCFQQPAINEHYYTFHIDIYATTSIRDFVNVLGRSILESLKPRGRRAWEAFINTLRSLQAQMTFDINNNPSWSIGLGDIDNPATTLDEIFKYLSQADRPCIVAIDEFQQITRYADSHNVEATLRTYMQRCINATFIFAGSKRHLMTEIFTSPARPFYQSVVIMNLQRISMTKYQDFAQRMFQRGGKNIEANVVKAVYEQFDGITLCLQRLMNVLYLKTPEGSTCTAAMIPDAIRYILDLFSDSFEMMLNSIPEKQREVFIAIAREGKAKSITSKNFLKRHHLQTPSVATAAARGLLDKDFITHDEGTYQVYDPFLTLWLTQ
ncbi:MAG: ATP-binding protein [Bacteroidaceae bacterium]|nr:ATP-binding protein [Bacteroidaceae bacterium]